MSFKPVNVDRPVPNAGQRHYETEVPALDHEMMRPHFFSFAGMKANWLACQEMLEHFDRIKGPNKSRLSLPAAYILIGALMWAMNGLNPGMGSWSPFTYANPLFAFEALVSTFALTVLDDIKSSETKSFLIQKRNKKLYGFLVGMGLFPILLVTMRTRIETVSLTIGPFIGCVMGRVTLSIVVQRIQEWFTTPSDDDSVPALELDICDFTSWDQQQPVDLTEDECPPLKERSAIETIGIIYLGFQISAILTGSTVIYKGVFEYLLSLREVMSMELSSQGNQHTHFDRVWKQFQEMDHRTVFLSYYLNIFCIVPYSVKDQATGTPLPYCKIRNTRLSLLVMPALLLFVQCRILTFSLYTMCWFLFDDRSVTFLTIVALMS